MLHLGNRLCGSLKLGCRFRLWRGMLLKANRSELWYDTWSLGDRPGLGAAGQLFSDCVEDAIDGQEQ